MAKAETTKKPAAKDPRDRAKTWYGNGDTAQAPGQQAGDAGSTPSAPAEAIPDRHKRERGEALDRHDGEHTDMRKRHGKELTELMDRHASEIGGGAAPADKTES